MAQKKNSRKAKKLNQNREAYTQRKAEVAAAGGVEIYEARKAYEAKKQAQRADAKRKGVSLREMKRRARGVAGGKPKPRLLARAKRRLIAKALPNWSDGRGCNAPGSVQYW